MSNRLDFVYLNEQQMIQAGVMNMDKCLESMEDMFILLHKNDYRMGGESANEHGIRVSFPEKSDVNDMPKHKPDYRFMAMPAYLGGRFKMFGIKTYGSNPDNCTMGLPRSILMMQLMDVKTGVPLAYMSANILSAMRTGATAGLGVKYLANKDSRTVAIIGPGTMSKYTIRAFISAMPSIEKIKIKGRSQEGISAFVSYCEKHFPRIKEYIICDTIKEACREADIIFYGTTNAAQYEDNPTVKKEWLKRGVLVVAASALLVEPQFMSDRNVKLVADNYAMYDGWGNGHPTPTQKNVSTLLGMGFYDAVSEGYVKRNDIANLGDIIVGEKKGREFEDQIVLYAVGGMPIEDVAWGHDVYRNALKKGIGTKLNLWEESEI